MSELKAGGKVTVLEWYFPECKPPVPFTTTVVDPDPDQDGDILVELGDGDQGFATRWEVLPVKATPKVGDVVRVVLEGKVVRLESGVSWFENINDGWGYGVKPDSPYTKSVEIITPAKPSVAGLPCCSVVMTDDGLVLVKRGASWNGIDGANYVDSDVDRMGWVQLVEAKPE